MLKFLLFILLLTPVLQAHIVEITTLDPVEEFLLEIDPSSLVCFDVDNTLIVANDPILRPQGYDLIRELAFKHIPKSSFYELYSRVLLQAQFSLLDPKSLSLIASLQQRKIPVIGLTALFGGAMGSIPSCADWRIQHLKSLGFDFSSAFPQLPFFDFWQNCTSPFPPLFKEGILFSGKHPKGESLKEFLHEVSFTPKRVIFIDDRLDFLKSVEKTLSEMGIPYTGFHYRAVELLPTEIDERVAAFQVEYLIQHGIWLKHEEAKSLVSCSPV